MPSTTDASRSGQLGADPLPPPPHMDEDDRRRRSGEDLISGLPDELLHGILVRLRCARAAARTSVLSRRWRHIWAHLPDLHLDEPPDTVDGALAGYLAPALGRLAISLLADPNDRALAGRAAPWLRFAAERVAGELRLCFEPPQPLKLVVPMEEANLELPTCGRAQRITLFLGVAWRLRLRPGGLFPALTALTIHHAHMEGGELSHLVCTQCPRLSYLNLLVTLVAASNVTIRSDSLRSLCFRIRNIQRLELVGPRLEKLALSHSVQALSHSFQAYISAPKLARLVWHGNSYDPHNHLFLDVGRCLRLLEVISSNSASLMRRFDEADVLKLRFRIPRGTTGFQGFLNGTKRLPNCKTLNISFSSNYHGLAPTVLHLLRSCNSTRKLLLTYYNDSSRTCPPSCPCCLEESRRIDGIDLGSLNEVEISYSKNFHEGLEFLELLFRCNARVLKKLVINYKGCPGTPEANEICEKVHNMCPPNVEVEFYVFPDGPGGKRVPLD